MQTRDTMEQEHQNDDARGKPATPSTPSSTTKKGGHNARPAPKISETPEAGSTHQARHPHIPPTRYTANARIQQPTTTRTMTPAPPTHPSPGGGETTRGGATRRQLEPEPDQTLSQRTDYSGTSRTASTVTRQRTPSQDRTEYSQNTYYNHITRGDACDPTQEPAPSQHTDYSDGTTNQSTNAAPCRRTPSPNHTEYSAQDTDHCGTPHHEAP